MTINVDHIILGSLLAGSPLVSIEILSRCWTIKPEISRKSTHLFSALASSLLVVFCRLPEIAVIGFLFVIILVVSRRKQVWHSLYRIQRKSWGEVTFPLAVAVTALLAPSKEAFVIGMLFLGLADTAASLLGQRFGQRHLPVFGGKTWVGSLACLVCCYIIGAAFAGQILSGPVAGLAIAVTVAEAAGSRGFDNLLMPVTAMLFIRLVGLQFT